MPENENGGGNIPFVSVSTLMTDCKKEKPLINYGSGTPPELNYSLPITTAFSIDALMPIPVPREDFGKDFSTQVDTYLWNLIKELSFEEVYQEVLNVLQGKPGKHHLFMNENLLLQNPILTSDVSNNYASPPRTQATPYRDDEFGNGKGPHSNIDYTYKGKTYQTLKEIPISTKFGNPYDIASTIKNGAVPIVSRRYTGEIDLRYQYEPPKLFPRLYMILHYKVASYAREYGAAKTVNTFSLLPGEKFRFSIRTYTKIEQMRLKSENVLDSFSNHSANTLENIIQSETQSQQNHTTVIGVNDLNTTVNGSANTNTDSDTTYYSNTDAQNFDLSGSIGAGFPIGNVFLGASFSGSGGTSNTTTNGWNDQTIDTTTNYNGLSNTQTQHNNTVADALAQFNNTLQSAISQSVAESNYHRQVEINTTTSENYTSETETATVRELSNINWSCCLNIIFRQLTQKYLCLTYLDSVSFGFTNGDPNMTLNASLSDVELLLKSIIPDAAKAEMLLNNILLELANMHDWEGNPQAFVVCKDVIMRSNCGESTTVTHHVIQKNPALIQSVDGIRIKGLIVDVSERILNTDHVIADALLGHGEALDCYNTRLQEAAADKSELLNIQTRIQVDKEQIEMNNYNAQLQLQIQAQQIELDRKQQELALALQEKQQALSIELQEKQLEMDRQTLAISIINAIDDPLQKAEQFKRMFGNCCDTPQTQIIS